MKNCMPTKIRKSAWNKFLDTHVLTQETENLLITSEDVDLVINNLPMKESPGTDSFTGEFY